MSLHRSAALLLAAGLALGAAPAAVAAPAPTSTTPSTAPSRTTDAARAAAVVDTDPAPTAQSIVTNGPHPYTTKRISRASASGYGGGVLYYPTDAAGRRFPGVVTIPGYLEPGSVNNLFGPRLASHGFVVLVADVVDVGQDPSARARTARAAVAGLRADTTVGGILDSSRIGLIGHSMGGGGVLEAAESMDLGAVIALHPYAYRGFPGVTEPTLVVGGLLDNVAPASRYSTPIYRSLTSAREKGLLTHLSGTHWAGVVDDPRIQGRNLAFLKTFLAGDERYRPFWCAPAPSGTTFSSTC